MERNSRPKRAKPSVSEYRATSVLKEYLLRGLVRDQRIGKLEKRMTAAERSIDTIIYMLMPALPENREPIGFRA